MIIRTTFAILIVLAAAFSLAACDPYCRGDGNSGKWECWLNGM